METFTSQVAPAARTPPERLMILVPGIAPKVPPQVLVRLDGLATNNPVGRLSAKLRPVSSMPELLVMVNLRVTGAFGEVVEGLKLLVNVGAVTGFTDRLTGAL